MSIFCLIIQKSELFVSNKNSKKYSGETSPFGVLELHIRELEAGEKFLLVYTLRVLRVAKTVRELCKIHLEKIMNGRENVGRENNYSELILLFLNINYRIISLMDVLPFYQNYFLEQKIRVISIRIYHLFIVFIWPRSRQDFIKNTSAKNPTNPEISTDLTYFHRKKSLTNYSKIQMESV